MANSTATLTQYGYPKGSSNTQKTQTVRGTVSFSIGTYPAGGFTLNWGSLEGVKSIPPFGSTPSSSGTLMPVDADFKSVGNPPSGVSYVWDNVTGNLHIYEVGPTGSTVSGPMIEMYTNTNLPGWIISDVVQFRADFVHG